MKHIDVPQRSPEWIEARRGMPTASNFDRIITPKTRKPSTQATAYMYELIAEWAVGGIADPTMNQWMQRGIDLEGEAVAWYEFETGNTATPCGLFTLDDGSAGASPDRMVGGDGVVEVKCLAAGKHLQAVDNVGDAVDAYTCQIQGQLWVTGRQWCDRVWFSGASNFPSTIVRVPRDDEFIAELAAAVASFAIQMRAARDRLIAKGLRQVSRETREAAAVDYWGLEAASVGSGPF